MNVAGSRVVLQAFQLTRRLDELDDLWTAAADAGPQGEERAALAAVGAEIVDLLRTLADILPAARDLALGDVDAFDKLAAQAVDLSPMSKEQKAALTAEYAPVRWSNEVMFSLATLEKYSADQAADIEQKIKALRDVDASAEGDFWPWYKCAIRLAGFGLSIGGAVLSGGTLAILGVSVVGAVLSLADGLPGCRADARANPDIAEELDRLGTLRDLGDIDDREFQLLKWKTMGVMTDEDVAAWKAAARDGTPWAEPAAVDCPAVPTLADISALDPALRILCYREKELTFTATLVWGGNCASLLFDTPDWMAGCLSTFKWGGKTSTVIVAIPPELKDAAGSHKQGDSMKATMTAHVDDPGAATCAPKSGTPGEPTIVAATVLLDCRAMFVATSFEKQ
ncbi:MAG TPA: hypothetical protein VJ867_12880 [Gemmatimonadaceae bacterium]|nr:hypothetical protein [Gemmatimonadaceae bacterium]